MRIEDLTPGISLIGLEPSAVATIVAVVPIADGAVQVIYKTPDGTLKDRLLGRADEASIAIATKERPWAFDGDGEALQARSRGQAYRPCLPFRPHDGRPYLER